jgi:hypothetical protein
MPHVRRLTAILAADVAAYSRLMGADEDGTHERLQAHLGELVSPKITEHRGRIVKNTGSGATGPTGRFNEGFLLRNLHIRNGKPVGPGFDAAVTRPRLLDAILRAFETGMKQLL